jgi:hypothetical protein
VILALFNLDPSLLVDFKPEVTRLLDFVDKNDKNEWVLLVSVTLLSASLKY